MVSRKKLVAIVALIFLLVASSAISVAEYNQASSLQNLTRKLQRSLSLAQLPLSVIYINPNGSITGTNNIQRIGDLYVLTDNISGSINVQESNITIDGAGYTLQGYGGIGVDIRGTSPFEVQNVTIRNMRMMDFNLSIRVVAGVGNHTFYKDFIGKTVDEVEGGILLDGNMYGCNITCCSITGLPAAINMAFSEGNIITKNNLFGGILMQQGCSNEFVDRNCWSDYLTRYPNATEIASSGIGDTPYVFNTTTLITGAYQDNHPLMKPFSIQLPSPTPRPTLAFENPIDMYASGLPLEIIQKLRPLGNDGRLEQADLNLIFAIESLHNYANSSTVYSAIDAIMKDGKVTDDEAAAFQDIDHDYVSNTLEIERYKTDPTKMDTSGLGIDDFNAIFTYGLDPNNKTQIQQFLAAIPNVSPRQFYISFGGVGTTSNVAATDKVTNQYIPSDASIIEVSTRDPLIQYLAKRSNVTWNNYTKTGHLFVDGTPLWSSYNYSGNPSYYFTHGRIGICEDTTLAAMSILNLLGYKTLEVTGRVPLNGTMDNHVWCETVIEGNVYVVNFGELIHREGFYQRNGWIISESNNYSPDWYLK